MPEVSLIVGPPGTGKTHTLVQERLRALLDAGVMPGRIALCSYTRAAAEQASERAQAEFGIDRAETPYWNTLHSIGLRRLRQEQPALDVAKASHWREFFESHGIPFSGQSLADFEDDDPEAEGDRLKGFYDWRRVNLLPLDVALRRYANRFPEGLPFSGARAAWLEQAWDTYKTENDLTDFGDMLEALHGSEPLDVDWLIVDEAQDLTPIQVAIVQGWAEHAETIIGCDPDQAIYSFQGADPAWLLRYPPKTVLGQSRRVPQRIQQRAASLIGKNRRRHAVSWLPRQEPGRIVTSNLDALPAAIANAGGSWFVLARNRFYLKPVMDVLNDAGLAYWNRSGWCPLARLWRRGKDGEASPLASALRLALGLTVAVTEVEAMRRDRPALWLPGSDLALRDWRRRGGDLLLDRSDMGRIATEPLLAALQDPGRTLALYGLASWQARYYLGLARRYGPEGLFVRPEVEVGTIHCSPADELIATRQGVVPIADLRTEDRLISYYQKNNTLRGIGNHPNSPGYSFSRSVRRYSGNLIVFEADGVRCRVTPNHRVIVRFDMSQFLDRWAVYLMRRGDWWRVGFCTTAHRPYRSGGLNGRLATEDADDGWLLSIHDRREDAIEAEALIQGTYGIPGLTFRGSIRRALSDATLASIHERTAPQVAQRAVNLLRDMDWDPSDPLYGRRDGRKNWLGQNFVTSARNLIGLSDRICVLTIPPNIQIGRRTQPVLRRATVRVERFDGQVYGLDVPPTHFYVSGGMVVHNSTKGLEADHVALLPNMTRRTAYGYDNDPEPERRVWYVGMTRARQSLWLLDKIGGRSNRFFEEL